MEQITERRAHRREIEVLLFVEHDQTISADVIDSANDAHRDEVMEIATYSSFGPIVSFHFARRDAHLAIAMARALEHARIKVLRGDLMVSDTPTLHERICVFLFVRATNGSRVQRIAFRALHTLYVLPARVAHAVRDFFAPTPSIPF